MSTPAKRRGNSRYLATLKTVSIRMTPEQAAAAAQLAKNSGKSLQGLFLALLGAEAARQGIEWPPSKSALRGPGNASQSGSEADTDQIDLWEELE